MLVVKGKCSGGVVKNIVEDLLMLRLLSEIHVIMIKYNGGKVYDWRYVI